MAAITFTDSIGAATLQSSWPAPIDRFQNWVPGQRGIGEAAHALGDGVRYQWVHRTDYTASFEIAGIANTDCDIAIRLIDHLLGGGSCAVATGDASSNSYATCGLAPDTEPELTFDDRAMLEYRLRLTLLDVSVSPAPLLCEY